MVNPNLYRGSLSTHTSKQWASKNSGDQTDFSENDLSFHESFSFDDASERSITSSRIRSNDKVTSSTSFATFEQSPKQSNTQQKKKDLIHRSQLRPRSLSPLPPRSTSPLPPRSISPKPSSSRHGRDGDNRSPLPLLSSQNDDDSDDDNDLCSPLPPPMPKPGAGGGGFVRCDSTLYTKQRANNSKLLLCESLSIDSLDDDIIGNSFKNINSNNNNDDTTTSTTTTTDNNNNNNIEEVQKIKKVHFDINELGQINTTKIIMDRNMPNDYRLPMFYTANEYDDMKMDASYHAEDYIIDYPDNVQQFESIILKESYMNLPMLALPAWKKQVLHTTTTTTNNNNIPQQNDSLLYKMIYKWSLSNGRGLEEMIAPMINETSKKSLREILKEYHTLRGGEMNMNDISFIISEEYIRNNEGAIRLAHLLALGDELVAKQVYNNIDIDNINIDNISTPTSAVKSIGQSVLSASTSWLKTFTK